eukprot:scaffold3806_cov169-Amphora_coffeaeformis.AAC.23
MQRSIGMGNGRKEYFYVEQESIERRLIQYLCCNGDDTCPAVVSLVSDCVIIGLAALDRIA